MCNESTVRTHDKELKLGGNQQCNRFEFPPPEQDNLTMFFVIIMLSFASSTIQINERNKRNAVSDRKRIWQRKVIPYEIHPNVWNETAIKKSIVYFNTLTCVQWVERTKLDINLPYVIFKPDSVCRSEIGQTYSAIHGQDVFIGPYCSTLPIILHEMYHVMGFYHEMKRYDRDKYIEINWDNITPGYEKFFDKLSPEETDFLDEHYDVKSVMHYDSFSYSKQPKLVTISLVNSTDVLAEANMPNKRDVEKVRRLYDCRVDATEGWSRWSAYTSCNDQCYKRRTRFCYSIGSQNACNELDRNIETGLKRCSDTECSRDGWWSRWSTWNECNVYCGNGKQKRYRDCTDPPPRRHGNNCTGLTEERKHCRRGACVRGKFDCEFDNDGVCYWKLQGDWERSLSGTTIEGPVTDVSFIVGYYMLLGSNQHGRMKLQFAKRTSGCMNFYYDFGTNSKLEIHLYKQNGVKLAKKLKSNGIQGWKRVNISLSSVLRVELFGSTGNKSFIALDDIMFLEKSCKENISQVISIDAELSTTAVTHTPVSTLSSGTTVRLTRVSSTKTSTITKTKTGKIKTNTVELISTEPIHKQSSFLSHSTTIKNDIIFIYLFIIFLIVF